MYNSLLHFHFIGIGGSGMSGIAEVLLNLGFKVSGSDQKSSGITERLSSLGANVKIGHSSENLSEDASLVVYSSAVNFENPEIIEAKSRGLPVVRRAEVLAELMRLKYGVGVAGSHGKTTTTSMTAAILEHGGLDPTVVIGGQFQNTTDNNYNNSGSKLGKSNFLVAETDESDRSFLLLKPTIAIVTNIDNEHLNAYTSLTDLLESFEAYLSSVPFYGLSILCIDDPNVRALSTKFAGRKLTYGFAPDAQLRATDLKMSASGIEYTVELKNEVLGRAFLNVPARHLALNSLAAIAVGIEFGLKPQIIIDGLKLFRGVKRRLEIIGQAEGVTVMSDYGHHPTEIKATLSAIKESRTETDGRFIVVFQPHRYSRTRDCFAQFIECFSECDQLIVADIYAASETPIEGVNSENLCNAIIHDNKLYLAEKSEIFAQLYSDISTNDLVLFLGAGSVGTWAEQFYDSILKNSREIPIAVTARV